MGGLSGEGVASQGERGVVGLSGGGGWPLRGRGVASSDLKLFTLDLCGFIQLAK